MRVFVFVLSMTYLIGCSTGSKGELLNTGFTEEQTNLIAGIISGDSLYVDRLESGLENLDFQTRDGVSPLVYAMVKGRVDLYEHFLELGANPNLFEHDKKYSAIKLAIQNENTRYLSLLIEYGLDVNLDMNSANYPTPIFLATSKNNEAIINLLISSGADVKALNKYSETICSKAAEVGDWNIVRLLYSNGCDLWHKDSYGFDISYFINGPFLNKSKEYIDDYNYIKTIYSEGIK
ncbi:ankyrin repeat domain-containing protein [Agarivorans albus]|uniref:CNPV017 ankyrin repeat protein n=1 Tax=Agarivorans albus MKT 106 TaxID=1331007 RepID=R9PUH0_AGAAL|nr:ankyrin repeat domain-containing protein [Agarivorans albus]GAD04156.1 CNPV017 ankyrin repeat protein [Agarivorans albus MKT 106]